jgi:hypothetical protein
MHTLLSFSYSIIPIKGAIVPANNNVKTDIVVNVAKMSILNTVQGGGSIQERSLYRLHRLPIASRTRWGSYPPPAARPCLANLASLPNGASLATSTNNQVGALSTSRHSVLPTHSYAGASLFALLFHLLNIHLRFR